MGDIGEPGAPGNLWRQAATWPPPSTATPAYLASDGTLSFQRPAAGAAPRSFTYDPSNPVPTRGGQNLTIPAGPMDQRPVENRPDVLLFTSPALDKPVEITGRVRAKLWVSSDAPDTDFTVKLTDVYPDGRSMLLLDGIRRMRFRNGFEKPELMKPGSVYPITVDLWSTSMIINKGHRIRIAVSSSNYPRFDANPNNGQPSWAGGPVRVAHNTVYLDASRPSQVILPVVSAQAGG
jgi:putative CocE/NonD family hydrolase